MPSIYIDGVAELDGATPFEVYVLAELKRMNATLARAARQVTEMHAELEEFRPMLAVFKPRPNGGGSDYQKAGLLRSMRKAARGGGQSTD